MCGPVMYFCDNKRSMHESGHDTDNPNEEHNVSVAAQSFDSKLQHERSTWQSLLSGFGGGGATPLKFTDLRPKPFTGDTSDGVDFDSFANDLHAWIASLECQKQRPLSQVELLTLLRLSLAGRARKHYDAQWFDTMKQALSSLQKEFSKIHRSYDSAMNVFSEFKYEPEHSVSSNARNLQELADILRLPNVLVRRKLIEVIPYPNVQSQLKIETFNNMASLVERAQFLVDVLQSNTSG